MVRGGQEQAPDRALFWAELGLLRGACSEASPPFKHVHWFSNAEAALPLFCPRRRAPPVSDSICYGLSSISRARSHVRSSVGQWIVDAQERHWLPRRRVDRPPPLLHARSCRARSARENLRAHPPLRFLLI